MTKPLALIIDDEPDIRELLEITLSRMEIETHTAATVKQAEALLQKNSYNLCLTDMKLPDGNGIELVKKVQIQAPQMPVAVFTAHGNMDTAIQAMKAGAFDFISKPVEIEQLRSLISAAIKINKSAEKEDSTASLLIGNSASMTKLRQQITKLSRSQAPIYISGESGCGKELVARTIHQQGPRSSGPFIPVNCGAIPGELMESEFFGHKKGSFTGAHQDKQGLFQAAHGGTLFLDEVADLPLEMQVKLLRAIQEKAVRSIGTQQEIPIDVRILSATHKNLQNEINANNFRSDLFYRINVIELKVPTLKDRCEDIPLLCEFFLKRLAKESNHAQAKISEQALNALVNYHFPGNVRELENILEGAYTLCENNIIAEEDLSLPPAQKTTMSDHTTVSDRTPDIGESLDHFLEDIEKEVISNTLERVKWNKTNAAKELGITFRSLRYRLKKLGLDD